MTEESDLGSLIQDVEKLRKQFNRQRIYLGVLGIFVLLLLVLSFLNNPSEIIFIVVIAIIIIPIALIINELEKRGL
ncbi:MAG: hypothetical protein ACFFCX_02290 [Candidatus Sifarchaeia archaeon]